MKKKQYVYHYSTLAAAARPGESVYSFGAVTYDEKIVTLKDWENVTTFIRYKVNAEPSGVVVLSLTLVS